MNAGTPLEHCSCPRAGWPISRHPPGLLAAFAAIGSVFMGSVFATTAPPADNTATVQNEQQVDPPDCVDALSRILPGAFDYCLARKRWAAGWYTDSLGLMQRAAGWGNKDAQLALGVTYFNGDHVPVNRPLGLAWLGLAAERREQRPLQLLASAYSKSTPEEKKQAQVLMNELWPSYADATAAVKADKQYRRALRRLGRGGSSDQGLCIDGISGSPTLDMGQELRKPLLFTHYAYPGSRTRSNGLEGEFPIAARSCPSIESIVRILDAVYARTMRGWAGVVNVGNPQTLHADGRDIKVAPDSAQ